MWFALLCMQLSCSMVLHCQWQMAMKVKNYCVFAAAAHALVAEHVHDAACDVGAPLATPVQRQGQLSVHSAHWQVTPVQMQHGVSLELA
jgi:hypothetical protein